MPLVTTIAAGAKGADFAAHTADVDAWLAANDCTFVVRYIAGGSTWKHITPAEVELHHSRGIAILLNYEGSSLDYLRGAAGGRANASKACDVALALGYPPGVPLIVSVDTGLYPTQLPLAKAYVEAFHDEASDLFPTGLYGPVNLYHAVRATVNPFYWLPNATSWQIGLKPTDVVHVRQHHSLHPPGVDPNTALAEFAAWLPTPDPTPPPEDDMRYAIEDLLLGGAVYWADTLAPIGPELKTQLDQPDSGVKVVKQSHEPTTKAFLGKLPQDAVRDYDDFAERPQGPA